MDIYRATIIVALVIGIIRYKFFSKELKILFFFVAFGFLTEAFTMVFKALVMRNTMPVGNLYIPVSVFIIGLFYLKLLGGYVNRKIIIIVISAYEIICLLNLLFVQNILEFPNIIGSVGALIIIVFSLFLFSKIMVEAKIEKLSAEPVIWINSALLIYYAANFFFYILLNYNVKLDNEFARQTVDVYRVINILFYFLLSIGFWLAKKRKYA